MMIMMMMMMMIMKMIIVMMMAKEKLLFHLKDIRAFRCAFQGFGASRVAGLTAKANNVAELAANINKRRGWPPRPAGVRQNADG